MALYALKRFGAVLLILVVMSMLVFLATHALPANTAALILGQYSTPETQAALEHNVGLDLPLPVQYWHWARGILLHGDLGQSLVMERPIAPILWDALGKSAILSVAAMAVGSTVGLAMGVIAAVRRGSWPDHAGSIFAFLGIFLPGFFLGLLVIPVFWRTFRLLSPYG